MSLPPLPASRLPRVRPSLLPSLPPSRRPLLQPVIVPINSSSLLKSQRPSPPSSRLPGRPISSVFSSPSSSSLSRLLRHVNTRRGSLPPSPPPSKKSRVHFVQEVQQEETKDDDCTLEDEDEDDYMTARLNFSCFPVASPDGGKKETGTMTAPASSAGGGASPRSVSCVHQDIRSSLSTCLTHIESLEDQLAQERQRNERLQMALKAQAAEKEGMYHTLNEYEGNMIKAFEMNTTAKVLAKSESEEILDDMPLPQFDESRFLL